jgi:hypothetical protein
MSNIYIMKQTYDFYREADNVYVNLSLSNEKLTPILANSRSSLPAVFDIQNDSPFLDDASQYYCSVVRFDIPLNTIPILIMPIQQFPNTDVNLTTFVVGIDVGGTVFPITLEYTPEDLNLTAPLISVTDPSPVSPYYFMYTYQTLINMINTGLYAACLAAGVAAPYPYVILNTASGLLSMVVPTAFTFVVPPPVIPPFSNPLPITNRPQIVMNFNLATFFDAFPFYINTNNYYYFLLNGQNFPPTANQVYSPPGPAGTFIFTQEYSSLPLWSSLKDIIFLTNKLPINYESKSIENGTNTSRIPILTDFTPIINIRGESRSIAYYLPSAQYRLVDMYLTTPLQAIDIKIIWRDAAGNIYPLLLAPGQQINIKLAFLRKTLYKHSLLR